MAQTNYWRSWRNILSSFQARLLIWYFVLMSVSAFISVVAIRQILFERVQQRVEKSLIQEVQEFRRLTASKNPLTGEAFGNDVAAMFDLFLSRNVPDDDEFFIAILNGQFYKASPRAVPTSLDGSSKLVERWAKLTRAEQGVVRAKTDTILYLATPIEIAYRVEPLQTTHNNRGVFVVAHVTRGEREEVDEALLVISEVLIAVVLVASIFAWILTGRLLAPLHLLTETARAITESDFTKRIAVQGSDEVAELGNTFNEMLDRLETAFITQRDFINDAGHELRTPITIIRGHLELLGDDPHERRETVEIVTDELDCINRFVDDLLLLAKTEQPNFLKLEIVDVGLLMEEVYTKVKALADRDWQLENKGLGLIVADRQRLTQAIANLAENATQHTQKGDIITIGSVIANHQAQFWVRDTGIGIALSEQKRIFERFARTTASHRRSEGAGLGLAIVRAIALAHHGKVELFSRSGVGSTFMIIMPLDPPQEFLGHEQDFDRRRRATHRRIFRKRSQS